MIHSVQTNQTFSMIPLEKENQMISKENNNATPESSRKAMKGEFDALKE